MSIQVTQEITALESTARSGSGDRHACLAQLLSQGFPAGLPQLAWVDQLRDRALTLIQDQALPTTRDEEWRFTDLSPLYQVAFQPVNPDPDCLNVALEELNLTAAELRLVFVNGVYAPQLSSAAAALPNGLVLGRGADLDRNWQPYLGQQPGTEEIFTALNTVNFADVAVLWIGKNQAIAAPIRLMFVTVPGTGPGVVYPRCLVVAAPGSAATLVEEYVTLGQGTLFTNAVSEIWVGENAQLHHSRIQRESYTTFHIGKTAVSQARDSRYTLTAVNIGGQISRHNPEVIQTGEQAQTTLNGLTLAAGNQISDTHSAIAFTRPYGISRQLHKTIVDDRARAVFNGKVWVPQAAQLTDAGQLSRNLLLSPKARVDTKPQLEIVADNVKCSHGATVSQLDEEELFYLRSRGLDPETSRNLLIDAFAAEILHQLPLTSLRRQTAQCVACKTVHPAAEFLPV